MTNPMIRIHNTETDEIIDRAMNDVEFKDYEAMQASLLIPAPELTIEQKLESIGLTIPDLKTALGL